MNKDVIATLFPSFKNNNKIILSDITTLPELTLSSREVITKIEDCCISITLNANSENNIIKFCTNDRYISIDPMHIDTRYDAMIEIYVEKDNFKVIDPVYGTSRYLSNIGSNIHEHIKSRLISLIGDTYNHYLMLKLKV